jgi:mRNA-degrading endonuclease toxin of MazEF toxin-antitoxin module
MPNYVKEASDIPVLVVIRPSYDNTTGAVTSVSAQFNYHRRVKSDVDVNDQLAPIETASKSVDLFDNVKTVSIAGIGNITYRQIAAALKKVADAERGS